MQKERSFGKKKALSAALAIFWIPLLARRRHVLWPASFQKSLRIECKTVRT